MKRSENRAGHPNYPKHMGAGGQQAEDIPPRSERGRRTRLDLPSPINSTDR